MNANANAEAVDGDTAMRCDGGAKREGRPTAIGRGGLCWSVRSRSKSWPQGPLEFVRRPFSPTLDDPTTPQSRP